MCTVADESDINIMESTKTTSTCNLCIYWYPDDSEKGGGHKTDVDLDGDNNVHACLTTILNLNNDFRLCFDFMHVSSTRFK